MTVFLDNRFKTISEVDWECILVNHATDPDKLFSTFYKKFNKIVNKHAPITKLSKRVKLWNEMPCHIRDLPKKKFRKVLHRLLSDILKREDDYIETPLIVEKVRLIV